MAMARIDAALARIEAAAARPLAADQGLADRHDRLRSAVSEALSHIDELLAEHEG